MPYLLFCDPDSVRVADLPSLFYGYVTLYSVDVLFLQRLLYIYIYYAIHVIVNLPY